MASPAQNTKIERAVEAIESLTNAVIASHGEKDPRRGAALYQNVTDARAECAEAFREFLAPTLRLATHEGERVA